MSDGEAAARLGRVYERALGRFERRRAATNWFWHWCRKKFDQQPRLQTKVTRRFARTVPALTHSPVRGSHVCYEDCLALEDQALVLLNRLWRKHGKEVKMT